MPLSDRAILNLIGISLILISAAGMLIYEPPPPKLLPGVFRVEYRESSSSEREGWTTHAGVGGNEEGEALFDLSGISNITRVIIEGKYSSSCRPERLCGDPSIVITVKGPGGETLDEETLKGSSGGFRYIWESGASSPEPWETEAYSKDEVVEKELEEHPPTGQGAGVWTITFKEERDRRFVSSETKGEVSMEWHYYSAEIEVIEEPRAIEMEGHLQRFGIVPSYGYTF